MDTATTGLDTKKRGVVIHLVHGTCPNGPFRKVNGTAPDVWFNPESAVCREIAQALNRPVQFVQFLWSGKNSFRAREEAAEQLLLNLVAMHHAKPHCDHVVLAHSHGGTVAMHAVYRMSHRTGFLTGRLPKAIICMASPFAYVTKATEPQRELAGSALTGLLVSGLALAGLLFFPGLPPALFWVVWFLVAPLCDVFVQVALAFTAPDFAWDWDYDAPAPANPLPFFLIRATRDEAALGIGFAQGLNTFTARLYDFMQVKADFKHPRWTRNIISQVVETILCLPIGILLAWLAARLSPALAARMGDISGWLIWMACLFLGRIVWSLVTIFSYLAVCLSVGMFRVRYWGQVIVEVDAAPPQNESRFVSVSDPESTASWGMRHGIYQLADVRAAIIDIINRLPT